MVLSLLPSLLTTRNSISPLRSSMTAGFSCSCPIEVFETCLAFSEESSVCFGRFEGLAASRDSSAFRFTVLRLEGLLLFRAVSIGGLGVGDDCSGSNDEVEECVSSEEGEVEEMSAGGDDPGGNEDGKGRSSGSGDKALSAVAPRDGELLVPGRKPMRFPRAA